jgi:hypothetical protein
MTDGDEIRNLLGAYCERIDAGDFDGVGALFADGVLADEHGTELARGADGVAAFYRAGTRLHDDGTPRTKHLVANSILELDGDAARVRSSYLVLQATGTVPLQPIVTGRYHDSFARGDGGWHFTERRFFVDLLGDLSDHLTFDLR